jgi:hypothetical protein
MQGAPRAEAKRKATQVKNPKTGDYAKRNETPGSKKKGEFVE